MSTVSSNSQVRQSGQFRRELLPSIKSFIEGEGCKVGRQNSAGWSMVCGDACPTHRSKSKRSFSIHRDGGFFCHGCHAKGGDLVAFVRLRDGCDFKTAAQSLGAWDGNIPSPLAAELREKKRKRDQERDAEVAKQAADRRRRLDARDLLHNLERHHKLTSARLSKAPKGALALEESEWELLQLLTTAIAEAELEYLELSGLAQ